MNILAFAVLMQFIGVIVVIAEIIIPSGGLLGAAAIGFFGYSLYLVFHDISAQTGMVFVAVDIVMIPCLFIVGIKMLAKSPATLNTMLSRQDGVTSQSPELEKYLHQQGRAVSDLRPGGVAMITGRKVDVVSRGEYIDKNSELLVIAVTGNQVIVKKTESTDVSG